MGSRNVLVSLRYVQQSADARVAVISWRKLTPQVSRCGLFQFEDTISKIDAADIIAPTESMSPPAWVRRLSNAARRIGVPRPPMTRLMPPRLDREYELLLVICSDATDLARLGPLEPWLQRSRRAACFLGEMWNSTVPHPGSSQAAALAQFDHVFLGCFGTTAALARTIERPVTYMPVAVDALAFCPYPEPPARCIDIYSMGRRCEPTHRATKALADERNLFYLYDTRVGNTLADPDEHRRMLARLIQRTKYFVTYPGKVDLESTRGQEEVGARYFEGAAAGAVLIGRAPDNPAFERFFGYEGAVVDLPFGSEDIASVYDDLESDPSTVEQIRLSNIRQSLLHHDWAYHWKEALEELGLNALPQLDRRIESLRDKADSLAPRSQPNTLSLSHDEA